MRIQHIRSVTGPNLISHNPILVMRLDLQELTGKECCQLAGFVDRLLAALPGLHEHHGGTDSADGFAERLREGTYFGHIVEHVCLELTGRAGIPVNRGKTIRAGADHLYDVCVEHQSERGMRRLLEIAVEFVESLIDGQPYPMEERIDQVIELVRTCELGPSTKAIVDAAVGRGIPCTPLSDDSLIQLGYGKHRKFIQSAISSDTSAIAMDTAGDKSLTKALLARAGVPAPVGRVVESADAAVRAFEELGAPVVVKPLDGNQGKGVSLDICTSEQVCYAFEIARQISPRIVIEELLRGRDYRVLVVNGTMQAACERIPACVTGDGRQSIQELVDETNRDPRRGDGHSKPMSRIRIDRVTIASLGKQGYRMESVPAAGARVFLREHANLSTGGSATDVTDQVHASMRLICERAARAIGLNICGVDLVVPDITQAFSEGGVVEVNAAAGFACIISRAKANRAMSRPES